MYKDRVETTPAEDYEAHSRRSFLTIVVGAGGALWAAAAALPVVRYFQAPPMEEDTTTEVEVGDPAQYAPGSYTRVAFGKKPVFLVALEGGEFLALSAICTHLGCVVSVAQEGGGFACPCHGGRYAPDGTNVGGPPPKPLARYNVEVREGVLWIVKPTA